MYPYPLVPGGGAALTCGRGGGGVQIRARGQTLWFSRYECTVLCGLNGLLPVGRLEADGTSPVYNVHFNSKKAHNNVIIYFMARLAEVAVSFFLVLCCSIAH